MIALTKTCTVIQKQPPEVFHEKLCSRKFRKIHRNTPDASSGCFFWWLILLKWKNVKLDLFITRSIIIWTLVGYCFGCIAQRNYLQKPDDVLFLIFIFNFRLHDIKQPKSISVNFHSKFKLSREAIQMYVTHLVYKEWTRLDIINNFFIDSGLNYIDRIR